MYRQEFCVRKIDNGVKNREDTGSSVSYAEKANPLISFIYIFS